MRNDRGKSKVMLSIFSVKYEIKRKFTFFFIKNTNIFHLLLRTGEKYLLFSPHSMKYILHSPQNRLIPSIYLVYKTI